ncbi:LOW QUALITY PROTEIN: IRK-interacting protein-like [Actinidia eriantha]|uniref:LOW QUALITY PROTEIN: IRK-interacting protein-like n=1 Tax=Actinidia eriantha TaxID=165200 RepID=UPI00258CB065|nr:LOW QUALITY PROTEIN: IRK-interacting protein-like [Actinidia eriantha]
MAENSDIKNGNTTRQEIKAAIAKAVELRALHSALTQGNSNSHSPANLRYPSPSSVSHTSHFSARDYPVFTPSYEEEPLRGYQQIQLENLTLSECWEEYGLGGGNSDDTILLDYRKANASSRSGLTSELINSESHICPAEDQKSITGSCPNTITVLEHQSGSNFNKPNRRNSLGDFKYVSSCNQCRPAIISIETDNPAKNSKNSNIVVPLTDSHSSLQSQPRNRGLKLSWLFPRLKKKHRNENSPNRTESEDVSQGLGIMSTETLKRELMEANESRDAALTEVSQMKSSLGELKQKLEYLETYCEELKRAWRQAIQQQQQTKDSQVPEMIGNLPRRGKSIDGNGENLMPVSEEVMAEGFLQVVSEARLSVKQFCKTLVSQIEETDFTLMDNLNLLLHPYKLSLNSRYSRAVLYHLEAIINQSLYQDFENSVFQKNGSPKLLDPHQDRHAQFSSFVALRNLSWNEVLRKGTKYYSEEFSKFCDQKMSNIITTLNWTRPWPEMLLQSFFVTAKCIWLLHLLAFSFNPPLGIFRVEENRSFDAHFMEDVFVDKQRSHGPNRVKVMVMPGFYVQDRVLKCKVLCRYKSVV